MLFIIAIDPLQKLLNQATNENILKPIMARSVKASISMYANDAAIFINPVQEELQALKEILDYFGQVTGLKVNVEKTEMYQIKCDNVDIQEQLQTFPATLQEFPCKYLELPLHTRKLRKVDFQPLFDRVSGKLPN